MSDLTKVYRIIAVTSGGNQNAHVHREPVDGLSYHADQVITFPGGTYMTPNDEGDIPHREVESGDDQLDLGEYLNKYGVTWHFAK
jgi:hypothetical protein